MRLYLELSLSICLHIFLIIDSKIHPFINVDFKGFSEGSIQIFLPDDRLVRIKDRD